MMRLQNLLSCQFILNSDQTVLLLLAVYYTD